MDSACILACDIETICSQYDENLFGDHVCSSPCSRLLWGTAGMRLRPRLRLGLRQGLEGDGIGSGISTLDKRA